MSGTEIKQLNLFELKSEITKLLGKINSPNDLKNCLEEIDLINAQENKDGIAKILLKELLGAKSDRVPIVCFLLKNFIEPKDLTEKLWDVIKNENLEPDAKITVLNFLRDLDPDWTFESCEENLDDAQYLIDESTKQMLNTAAINPEVQIDFLDFMSTLKNKDKITLLNSFTEDYEPEVLANILIPVFLSEPDSPEGREALKLLAGTKSRLALHMLEEMQHIATDDLLKEIKRSLSTIKISGIREDNTDKYFKEILANSKPYRCYVDYPDGQGNLPMIFTRITANEKIRFISIVANSVIGIKACFGFYEISKFEAETVMNKFKEAGLTVEIDPYGFKTILQNSERVSYLKNKNKWKLPYEYACWKNMLADIDGEKDSVEKILEDNIVPAEMNDSVFDEIFEMKFTKRWFLNAEYSDEYMSALKQLIKYDDLEEFVRVFRKEVFNDEEKSDWLNRILMAAYLKYSIGKDNESGKLYGIIKSPEFTEKFFDTIFKKSIYEYLTLIKFDKNVEHYGLTHEDITDKIKYIEEKWVSHV